MILTGDAEAVSAINDREGGVMSWFNRKPKKPKPTAKEELAKAYADLPDYDSVKRCKVCGEDEPFEVKADSVISFAETIYIPCQRVCAQRECFTCGHKWKEKCNEKESK